MEEVREGHGGRNDLVQEGSVEAGNSAHTHSGAPGGRHVFPYQ